MANRRNLEDIFQLFFSLFLSQSTQTSHSGNEECPHLLPCCPPGIRGQVNKCYCIPRCSDHPSISSSPCIRGYLMQGSPLLFHSLPLNSTAAQPGVGSLAGGRHWRGTLPLAPALLPWPHCSCYKVAGCKQSRHICTSGHGQGGAKGR